jgi:hypothetical protein
MLRVTGRVARIESKPWTMEGRSGVTTTARIVVGDADFADVKIPDNVAHPSKGDEIDYAVVPGVSGGKVGITVRGDFAELTGLTSAKATRPAAVAKAS